MVAKQRLDRLDVFGATNNRVHGQDCFGVETKEKVTLVAVADGLSFGGTQDTARIAIDIVREVFRLNAAGGWSACRLAILVALTNPPCPFAQARGKTTLTVGWFEAQDNGPSPVLLDFLAIGDSPILVASPWPISEDRPDSYLLLDVHAPPIVRFDSTVYSAVDFDQRAITGRIACGARELADGDICLFYTDGVPMKSTLLATDFRASESHRFFNRIGTDGVRAAVSSLYEQFQDGDILEDDATLVAIHVKPPQS